MTGWKSVLHEERGSLCYDFGRDSLKSNIIFGEC